jgi:arabinose-5-phosphate isomerase
MDDFKTKPTEISHRIKQAARQVIDIEIEAIHSLYHNINQASFQDACTCLLECRGKIVVFGVGKSGHIGQKISASLASTGTPAIFIHPSEAAHGDLGFLDPTDVVIFISYSGNAMELITLLPRLQELKVPLITITGRAQSTLAQQAQISLVLNIDREACPLGLAPTASTTATLVLGDALAMTLLSLKNFTKHDFARSHPSGKLGKQLSLRVHNIMRTQSGIPIVSSNASLPSTLVEMSSKGLGMTAVTNSDNQLVGLFTDGDLRRILSKNLNLYDYHIADVMTKSPIYTHPNELAVTVLQHMQQLNINNIIVVNEAHQPIGALHLQDLLASGIH